MNVTLTPAEQQGLSFEVFADRQGCPFLPTEDGIFVLFENGASIQVRDPLRGMTIVANPSEPPIDDTDELSLRRRLDYFRLREEKEVIAWLRAKSDVLEQLRMRGRAIANGLSAAVPAPSPDAVLRLQGGADRCAMLRAKVVELEGHIAKLPSVIEMARREEENRKRQQAMVEAEESLYREISKIGIELPGSLRNAAAKQNLSV